MATDPEWVADMFNHFLDVEIALWEMVLAEGYRFDGIFWCDDMGYKGTQFFSLGMYRDLLKPAHARAIRMGACARDEGGAALLRQHLRRSFRSLSTSASTCSIPSR